MEVEVGGVQAPSNVNTIVEAVRDCGFSSRS
jgi:hypothetical protein